MMSQNKIVERYIIYLKNVIFFKFVISLMSLAALLWTLQFLQQELGRSAALLIKARKSLDSAVAKLSTTVGAEDKISEAYALYKKISVISNKQICQEELKLIDDINHLAVKYKLVHPIEINISQSFLDRSDQAINQLIKIKNYDVHADFIASDLNSVINFTQDAFQLMPEYSIIFSFNIEVQEVLTPEIIARLSPNKYPNLVRGAFKMRMRKIIIRN